jgi:hypothetical protein
MLALLLFAVLTIAPSQRHKPVRTPIDPAALTELLYQAHLAELGTAPSQARVQMARAVIRWENGNGDKVYLHNLGNLGAPRGEPYYVDTGGYYAAFPDFDAAARAFWRHLDTHCARALRWFDASDPGESASALKRCGYFSAPLAQYEAGLRRLHRHE